VSTEAKKRTSKNQMQCRKRKSKWAVATQLLWQPSFSDKKYPAEDRLLEMMN